jgi:hydrophobic/amphiphilic exporter-1 (mainly G- bacteria), HAE1 family
MVLSDLSIKRPVFAAVMMLALMVVGIFSFRQLAIDQFPNVDIPVVTIVTKYPGASPESVEREVTKKIEDAVNPVAGVKRVSSASYEGVSSIVVEFRLETKVNEAAQDVRSKVNAIRGDLPQTMDEPIIGKFDFAAMPIISLAVHSERLSPRELTSIVDKKVKRRIENVSGIGKVDLIGLSKREVNVNINPLRLQALGMGVDEVMMGLQSENVNTPIGRLNREGSEHVLRIAGKPSVVDQFKTMVIGQRGDRPILLGEVADIADGMEEQRSLAVVNGIPAIGIDVLKQSGANTVEVVNAVKKEVGRLQKDLPEGTVIDVVRDGSVFIRDSVSDVEDTLVLGGFLTILIVFCFLNSWRSTVITGLTLPISVISSFIVMYFLGMTLNTMTLMALSLAIGLLIDDAIVVRENIVRHLEQGQDHFTAAREATNEIGLAVMATTFSIIAVFVPVAFMKGIVGRFFFQFGISVAFAVLVSLFVSFTLDPMLSSRWYDPDVERHDRRRWLNRMLDHFNGWFDVMADRYRVIIGWALSHRKTVVAVTVAAFVGGIMLLGRIPMDFFPSSDQSEFLVNFKTSPDSSIEETKDRMAAALKLLRSIPEVEQGKLYGTIGAGDRGTVRDASVYVKLVDKNKRKRTQLEIQRIVRDGMNGIAGMTVSIEEAGRLGGRKPIMVGVQGDNIDLLKKYAAELKKEMLTIHGIVDVEMSMEHDVPEYRLKVDRERAVDSGLTTATIARTIGALVGGQAVSTFEDEDGDAINVRVRLPRDQREDPEQVQDLRMTVRKATAAGPVASLVTLGGIIKYEMTNSPSAISRQDLSRQVVLSANLDGIALGDAQRKINEVAAKVKTEPGYRVVFFGESDEMTESFGYMFQALVLAIILVYLILAAQFESFIDPLSIMLSLPLAVVGMAAMLFLTRDTLSMVSFIGLIMLMGLVTKNAILLIDYAKTLRSRGLARTEALITAGRTRLRPIMMTTLAMIFGMIPLALALGAGAEMRAPMARAVIGGLITSTVLTLVVVPVVYAMLDDFTGWISRRRNRKETV